MLNHLTTIGFAVALLCFAVGGGHSNREVVRAYQCGALYMAGGVLNQLAGASHVPPTEEADCVKYREMAQRK
jgi:hypothetical protein